jgi:steroid 5-alpha reductase family enzyme
MWSVIHLVVIAIAQPVLLLALALPLYAVLTFPPAELSSELAGLHIPLSAVQSLGLLSSSDAPPSTPVLTVTDLGVAIFALTCVFVEYKVDSAMFAYHAGKSAAAKDPSVKMVQPTHTTKPNYPQPTAYPASHHPGFPVHSWWAYSRHANFAAEQLFWVSQALFAATAARPSGVTLKGIPGGTGGIWGPALAVRLAYMSRMSCLRDAAIGIAVRMACVEMADILVEHPFLLEYGADRVDHGAKGEP